MIEDAAALPRPAGQPADPAKRRRKPRRKPAAPPPVI